jgi:hypothetical protein
MSTKNKLIYLKILMNIKNNVYKTNKNQLIADLQMIKRLLEIEINKDNQELITIQKNMQKMLKIA